MHIFVVVIFITISNFGEIFIPRSGVLKEYIRASILKIYSSNKLFLSPNLAEPINLFRNQFDFIDIKLPVL